MRFRLMWFIIGTATWGYHQGELPDGTTGTVEWSNMFECLAEAEKQHKANPDKGYWCESLPVKQGREM